MAEAFEIRGADDFLKLSKALKAAGQKELRKELDKAVKAAAKPVIADTRAAALRELPKSGGLAKRMATAPQKIVTRTGKNPGVGVVMPGKQPGYNDGVIRHPVFASKFKVASGKTTKSGKAKTKSVYANSTQRDGAIWVEQRIGPGRWFDDTVRASGPKVRPEIEAALEAVAARIIKEARRG